jgi:hypothetical protein
MASFFNIKMIYAICCFIVGHSLGWYAHNLQFVSEYWKDKVLLPIFLFGVPCLIAFWWGTRFAMEAHPELWTARFVAAVFSYLTFPIMTWWYLGESMFTLKTLLCVFLAFCILLIQIFVK